MSARRAVLAALAVLGLGAYLRWAAKPVRTAFGIGRSLGSEEGRRAR